MTGVNGKVIFPHFQVENQEPYQVWLDLREMHRVLLRGGFTVQEIYDAEGQLLDLVLRQASAGDVRFNVTLPAKWSLVAGYDGHGLSDPSTRHLIDEAGYLRGSIHLDWEAGELLPKSAEIYCRYALNPFNGFYNKGLINNPDDILDVVVDRAAVNRQKPHSFPVVMHYHGKSARTFSSSVEKSLCLLKKMEEDSRKEGPKRESPIYRWLHKNCPNWRDPFAYW